MSAIIFDFNGTMVLDSPYHDLAWSKFSKQLRGESFSEEEIEKYVHGKVNEKIVEYLKPSLSLEENKRLSLQKEALYRELCTADKENYRLVNGLPKFLDSLKENRIKCTIASASIKENIDFFISTFNLNCWFDCSKIIYDDGTYENKVKMFKDAAKKLNVDIEDCIIFEDSISGINCAKAVGAKHIIVIADLKKHHDFLLDPKIDMVIEDFTDSRLRKFIEVEND